MNKLDPVETELRGQWEIVGKEIKADNICNRIEWLINHTLNKVSIENWGILFVDPSDGKYWEQTFPQSELHGGGPPSLVTITHEIAQEKYNVK